MKKTVFLALVLAFSSLAFAAGKTYDIVLANPAKLGSVELKPGQYRLKVVGDQAIFVEAFKTKEIAIPVKVETAAKKFDSTRVDSTSDGKTDIVKDIQLGGSTTQLDF